MGGNGQRAGHGARTIGARPRTRMVPQRQAQPAAQTPQQPQAQQQTPPQPAQPPQPTKASADIATMRALAKKSGTAADQQLSDLLTQTKSEKVDANQQNTDTQRFFNAIGWTDNKPVVVADETGLEVEKFKGTVHGQYFYHTDMPTAAVPDAKGYADQHNNGRQFLSRGIHGDGTYWSNNENDSWDYGYHQAKSYQLKGMMNNNAKVIQESTLIRQISKFQSSHPKAAAVIDSMKAASTMRGMRSVYAALFGYNVIASVQGGHDYLAVLDRSATTVTRTGVHYSERGKKGWKIK